MTVSRVLHNSARVAADTRQRVLTAVEELGYRRNEVARSLRLGQTTGLVGLVVANLANPFYSQVALGAESALGEHGMRAVLANTGEDVEHERRVVADLVCRRLDGLIVLPASNDHAHLDPIRLKTPVVLGGSPPSGLDVDCVLVDDFNGARHATVRLLVAGHRRIGFLGLPPSVCTGSERFRGFCTALDGAGPGFDNCYDRRPARNIAAAEQAARDLLSLPEPPTALFCANNRNTIGAFRALRTTSPATALAGFDDFDLADMLGLPLTVVAYDPREVGRQAARLLLERIGRGSEDRDAASRRIVVPTTIVEYRQRDPAASRRSACDEGGWEPDR